MNPKIFISYSSADEELAKKLEKVLKEMGIDPSLGRRDTSGESYNAEEYQKALSECSAAVVVVSPASLKSVWVPFEVGHVMGAGKKILLLLSQPYLTVPAYLQGLHHEANLDAAKEYLKHMFDAPTNDKTKLAANKPTLSGSKLEILNYKDEKDIPAKASPSKKSTGIKSLDSLLEGGITCGSMVTIAADPRATAEVWLYQISQIERTFYFTTEKSPRDIQENIHLPNFNLGDIYFIDIYSHYINGISNDYILNMTENYLEKISDGAQERPTIIFDNFSFYLNLDIDPKNFKAFINRINKKIKKMEAVMYLYIFKQNNNQLEHLIYSLSDTIFEIGFKKNSERITNYLSVLKNKKGYLPKEAIRLKFEDGIIQIDTTKDVA